MAQNHPISVPCAETGLIFQLPPNWEAVATQHPSVRCAFRNSTSGYPTLNVLEEPKRSGAEELPKERQEADLLRSYHLVGLTDAAIATSELFTIGNRPAFQAVVRYTTSNRAMASVVTIITLEERVYTVTVLDVAEAFRVSENQLRDIGRAVRFEGNDPAAAKPVTSTGNGRSPLSKYVLIALFALITGAGVIAYRRSQAGK